MGVRACDRTECSNVMCRIITADKNFYFCDQCYDEFISIMRRKGMLKGRKKELLAEIKEFIETEVMYPRYDNNEFDLTKSEEEDGLVSIKSLFDF